MARNTVTRSRALGGDCLLLLTLECAFASVALRDSTAHIDSKTFQVGLSILFQPENVLSGISSAPRGLTPR